MPEFEQPRQPSVLPMVSSEVKNRIIEDMGGANPNDPLPNRSEFSENVFADLLNSNRTFVEAINDVLAQRITDQIPGIAVFKQDAFIEGMAIVIKAFDYTMKSDLLLRFASLQADDIHAAREALEASIPKQEEHTISIVQRLLTLPRIPDQQIDLNECINTAGRFNPVFQRQITTGATAMYKTLGALWPKLYPPQTAPPPSA